MTVFSEDAVGSNHMNTNICSTSCPRAAYWCEKPLLYRLLFESGASGRDSVIRNVCGATRRGANLFRNISNGNHAGDTQRDGASGKNKVAPGPPTDKQDTRHLNPRPNS